MTLQKIPVHPGEVLKELYLTPLEMSEGALAKRLGVPRTRIERLTKEQTGMTADTAMRLSRFFGNSVQFWLNLQTNYDVLKAEKAIDVSGIVPLSAA